MTRLAASAALCLAILALELFAQAADEARALATCAAACLETRSEPRP